jgi:urease accessory protein
MPAGSAAGYWVGFMLATGVLHAAGLGLGWTAERVGGAQAGLAYRLAGVAVAVTGIGLLVA